MFVNVYKLKKGCPKAIEEDMKEIIRLSKKLVDNLDIEPNQYIEQVKVDVQEAKDLLFQIISRFVTIISDNLETTDSKIELGYRLKFSEDIGSVIYGLRERGFSKIDKLVGITKLLNHAGEIKTIYDFIVYHPIIIANKIKEENMTLYIKRIFKAVRVNASILSSSERLTSIKPSQLLIPKPSSLFSEGDKKKSSKTTEESTLEQGGLDLAEDFVFDEVGGEHEIDDND